MKLLLTLLICTLVSIGYAYGQKALQKPEKSVEPVEQGKVIRVVDGDTFHIDLNGKNEVVRVIGMNSPELKSPNPRIVCFAEAARMKAEDLIGDFTVQLEADPTQGDRDKYGRLLRHVFWNKANFAEYMIKKGFAYEYTYDKPYKYQKEFRAAQKYAEDSKWGLWDNTECR